MDFNIEREIEKIQKGVALMNDAIAFGTMYRAGGS